MKQINLTDAEIMQWVKQQIAMFKGQAMGFGFEAIQAKAKLNAIEKLTDEEKLRIGRLNIETIIEEGQYLSQLPEAVTLLTPLATS